MTGNGDTPWWASGTDPDGGIGDEDPVTAHREQRRGAAEDGSGTDGPAGAGGTGPDTARPWWDEAAQAITAVARAAAHVRPDGAVPRDLPPHEHAATAELCDVCPVCVGLRALERSRPEMAAHLTEALHHVTLAVRSVTEAHGADRGASTGGMERIDLEDE